LKDKSGGKSGILLDNKKRTENSITQKFYQIISNIKRIGGKVVAYLNWRAFIKSLTFNINSRFKQFFVKIVVYFGENSEYGQAEKKLEIIIKYWPYNVFAFLELARLYKGRNDYRKADSCLQEALFYNPNNFYLLWLYAENAFEQGLWKTSIERLDNLIWILEKKENRAFYTHRELWLRAKKRIFKALFRMEKGSEIIRLKIQLFERLNNSKDLQALMSKIVKAKSSEISLKTEIIPRGISAYYTCLHRVYKDRDEKEHIVEKCLEKSSKEHLVYNIINQNDLFVSTRYAKVPKVRYIERHDHYTRLFLEYVKGGKKSLSRVDSIEFGIALGEIVKEFIHVTLPGRFQSKILKAIDLKEVERYLKNFSSSNLKEILVSLDNYNSHINKLKLELKRIPQVFSHNDLGSHNVIFRKQHNNEVFYFIDWGSASYNYIGADVGRETSIYKENLSEDKLLEIETSLIKGYHQIISSIYENVTTEDIRFSSYIHFINYGGKIAMENRDLVLFKEVCKKINYLLSLV